MQEHVALSNTFGAEVGRYFHELLERARASSSARASRWLVRSGDGGSRVGAVHTESGLEIPCDAVIVGAGVRPDTMLAQRAGLEVDDGIVCDSGLETSAPGIFAAGDCCSFESEPLGRRLRVEHWDVAFQQGRHAARGMLGDKQPYEVIPYFFSDLSDWASLEYVGNATATPATCYPRSTSRRAFLGLVPGRQAGRGAPSRSVAARICRRRGG